MSDPLWQNSDFVFQVDVFESDGTTPADANDYTKAEWSLYETGTCVALVTKTLGSGIAVSGTVFEVTIDAADITVSGVDGEYTHSFRVGTAISPSMPPIYDTTVPIIASC